jgi:elongation factor Ts
MNITASMVKELRERTNAGVLDCKRALEETGGDFDRAAELLRQRGLSVAEKKAEREASEGVIEAYVHTGNSIGTLIELNCETDFVARTEAFKTLAHDLAMHVAATSPKFLSRDDIPAEFRAEQVAIYREQARDEGKPDHIIDTIAEGRWNKFVTEIVLLEQPFIRDLDRTVEDLITEAIAELKENIVLRRFVRYELGDGADMG